jgi:hypothetical protein
LQKGWDYQPGVSVADDLARLKKMKEDKLKRLGMGGAIVEDATQKRDRLLEEARRDVVDHGKKTGNERLVMLDAKTGETLDAGNGTINNLILTDAMMALINDSNNAVRLIHNHPKSLSFSMEDLVIASQPGADSIEAVGHDGAWYKASLKINNSVLLEEKLLGINTEVMNCLGQLVSRKK